MLVFISTTVRFVPGTPHTERAGRNKRQRRIRNLLCKGFNGSSGHIELRGQGRAVKEQVTIGNEEYPCVSCYHLRRNKGAESK